MWITFFLPVCVVCVVKVVISFVVIENSTVGNVVVSFVVGEDSNDKDSLVDDADVDSCVDLSVIYYDKLKDVVNRFFSLFQSFFLNLIFNFILKLKCIIYFSDKNVGNLFLRIYSRILHGNDIVIKLSPFTTIAHILACL